MATIQEILDKINASKSNNVNNNSFIDLMRQISGNPEDAIAPVNDTNSIYGHIVQMYTTLYGSGVDYAILADEVDMLQGVYDNLIAINSVYADKTKLDSLYADKIKLDQLFADKAVIDRVYGSITNIDRVHTSIDKLDTVYASVLKMDTVADNIADVNTVADNMIVLNEIYDNRVEIYAADNNATVATTKAIEASNSASTALGYKNDVSAMKLAVETIYDTFDDRFLGTKTTNPVLDNDGNVLIDGAMYFNTTDNAMKVYDVGTTTWYSIPQIYLSGLLDVELTSITTGDILVWNGTKWANTANPKVDSIQLNGGSGTEGTISWNSTEQTLDITQDGTTLQVGQELQYIVRNDSGNTIANGTFVGFVGVTSGSNRIIAAPFNTSTMTAMKLIGFATEDIANGVNGRVTNFGYIRGLDTRGTEVTGMSVGDEDWSDGDVLYVHPTVAGKLTKVAPTSGIKAPVATVTNRHQTAGELFVNVIAIDQLKVDHGEAAYNRTTNIDNTSDATKNVLSATKLATARTINGVEFDGTANITTYDSTKVAKVASTNNAVVRFNGTTGEVKNSLVTIDDGGNLYCYRLLCTGLGNEYSNGGIEVRGNGSTVFPNIGFHQPGVYAGSLQQVSASEFSFFIQGRLYYAILKNNINMQNAINVNGTVGGSVLASNVIVESGSNANGSYTKFANGSLLEYKSISCEVTAEVQQYIPISWPVSGVTRGTGAIVTNISTTINYTMSQPPSFNGPNFFFKASVTQTYYFLLTNYTP